MTNRKSSWLTTDQSFYKILLKKSGVWDFVQTLQTIGRVRCGVWNLHRTRPTILLKIPSAEKKLPWNWCDICIFKTNMESVNLCSVPGCDKVCGNEGAQTRHNQTHFARHLKNSSAFTVLRNQWSGLPAGRRWPWRGRRRGRWLRRRLGRKWHTHTHTDKETNNLFKYSKIYLKRLFFFR